MAASERARHDLFEKLAGLLGDEGADTLMEGLHPRPWDEIATKHDLAALERRLDERFGRVTAELRADLHATITGQTRLLFFSMTGAIFTSASLAFAAAAF